MTRCNRLMMGLRVVLGVGLLGIGSEVWGQDVTASPTPRTFGTTEIVHVIGASEFDVSSGATSSTGFVDSLQAELKTSNFLMRAWVRLPAGALVTGVELQGCDTSPDGEIGFFFHRLPAP